MNIVIFIPEYMKITIRIWAKKSPKLPGKCWLFIPRNLHIHPLFFLGDNPEKNTFAANEIPDAYQNRYVNAGLRAC